MCTARKPPHVGRVSLARGPLRRSLSASEVTPRLDPVELQLRRGDVEQLHVLAVLPHPLEVDDAKQRTAAHREEEVAARVAAVVVAENSLSEGHPGALPVDLCFLLDLLRRSVRHWKLRSMDLQRLCKLVEHS